MEPNPAVGSDVGRAYISQEGFGRAAIYGPSQAADTYVTMRREKLAYERQQQAAQAKAAAEARSKAMEKLMEVPTHYEKYADEVLDMREDMVQMGAEIIDRGLDPFSASKDPAVREFQKKYQEVSTAAQTSITIKERDAEMAKTLAKEGAADDLDIEGYQQANDEFFKDSLLNISKRVDKMPTPQSRYGFIKAAADFEAALKTAFGTRVGTDEEIATFTAAYMADNERAAKEFVGFYSTPLPARTAPQGTKAFTAAIGQQMSKPLIGDFTKPELYTEASMNTKNMPIEAGVKFAKSVMGPFDFLGEIRKAGAQLRSSIGTNDWGTKEKEILPKAIAEATRMVRQYPQFLTMKDEDGLPYATGKNYAEKAENTINKLAREIEDYAKVDDTNPERNARLAHELAQKDKPSPPTLEEVIEGIKLGNSQSQGYFGSEMTVIDNKDATIRDIQYIGKRGENKNTFRVTYTAASGSGEYKVITTHTKDVSSEEELKRLVQPAWRTIKNTDEAVTKTWSERVSAAQGPIVKFNGPGK